MVQVTISSLTPSSVPASGWDVKYRILGTTGAYTTATGSPFSSLPIIFSTTDPGGTLYEVQIARNCGTLESTNYELDTPCNCTDTSYTSTGIDCRKTSSVDPTVTHSGYCLAPSVNGAYTNFGTRVYNSGFTLATLLLSPGTVDANIYGNSTLNYQWCNSTASLSLGPMNRDAVWIDTNCDGNKDALPDGTKTTIAFMVNNTGADKTIYVGIGGDNQFKLVVNGVTIVDTGTTYGALQFKLWHVIPVTFKNGLNYFNAVATGDGSTSDAIAMVGYNNTAAEILSATSDGALNILFRSSSLIGHTYDIATCPDTYSLDMSGGIGHYICSKILTKVCNSSS